VLSLLGQFLEALIFPSAVGSVIGALLSLANPNRPHAAQKGRQW
jgi:hypothetical protein